MTKETYLRSVDTLLDAYNNGELFHGNCDRCAVGNLLGTSAWQYDFFTVYNLQQKLCFIDLELSRATGIREGFNCNEESENIVRIYLDTLYSQHGFTRGELARIEYAFESSIHNSDKSYHYYTKHESKKGQFIGLTAVLSIMKDMVDGEEVSSQDSQERLEKIAREKYCVTI